MVHGHGRVGPARDGWIGFAQPEQATHGEPLSKDLSTTSHQKLRTICVRLAYEGTRYCGWQMQPGRMTVQGTLAEALKSITGESTKPVGSSRTDAGVHAIGQMAVFETRSRLTLNVLFWTFVKPLVVLIRFDPRFEKCIAIESTILAGHPSSEDIWSGGADLNSTSTRCELQQSTFWENMTSQVLKRFRRCVSRRFEPSIRYQFDECPAMTINPTLKSGSRLKEMGFFTTWFELLWARWSWLDRDDVHPNGCKKLLRLTIVCMQAQPLQRRVWFLCGLIFLMTLDRRRWTILHL